MTLIENQSIEIGERLIGDVERGKELGRWLNRGIYLRSNRRTKKHEVLELATTLLGELKIGGYRKTLKWLAMICLISNLCLAT